MSIDLNKVVLEKAVLNEVDEILNVIHKCIKQISRIDYDEEEVNAYLSRFNVKEITDSIIKNHFYVAKYYEEIIGIGAVAKSRDEESQSYLKSIFINPNYRKIGIGRKILEYLERDKWSSDSSIIEISASRINHDFYYKQGYNYYKYPPQYREDGSILMYKVRN